MGTLFCYVASCRYTFTSKEFTEMYRAVFNLLVLTLLVSLAGCGSSSKDFTFTQSPQGSQVLPGSVHENLHSLAQVFAESDKTSVSAQSVRAQQSESKVINGPAGGTATLSGHITVGPNEANPATSVLDLKFDDFQFYDGLILNGGTATLTTKLWGTEDSAQGSLILQAENVTFSGAGSGTHTFGVELDLVNSQVVRTVLTLDGKSQELGFIVHLVNKSASPPEEVFVTIIGKDAANTAWHYLAGPDALAMTEFEDQPGEFLKKDNSGAFVGSEKYSMTLADLTPIGPDTWRLIVPRENVVSGRIMFSFGRKLQGIGIIAPYYNSSGDPITSGATATGSLQTGNPEVTLSGIDATSQLAVNLPVSYSVNGTQVTAKITQVKSPTLIALDPAPTSSGSFQLSFTPDPALISAAKLSLSGPSPTGPPDYLTTFELMELSATTDATQPQPWYTLFANTTAIDFFSVGLGMTVNFSGLPPSGSNNGLAPSQKTVGFGATAADIVAGISQRENVIDRFNNEAAVSPLTPAAFQNFVTAQPNPSAPADSDPHLSFGKKVDKNLNVIRVLGPPPVVALQPTGLMATYLQDIITQEWGPFSLAASGLTINFPLLNPALSYLGTTPSSATTLNLECTFAAGSNTGQGEKYALPQPTTRIIWECDDTQNPGPLPNNYTNQGTDAHKRLSSIICAAFARGVFPNVADWSDSSKFYSRSDLKYNFFSKVMHDFALDRIVYGFAYDDVYGQDSTLAGPIGLTTDGKVAPSDHGNVVDVTLTIPNFTAPAPPALPGVPLRVETVIACGEPASLAGSVIHFTSDQGEDVNATLDAEGKATIQGLKSNLTYTAWIAPGGANASDWFFSYSARGKYDGTTGGAWNSSFGASTPGVVRLQIGRLQPGVGSCLNPQPQAPQGTAAPLPTEGSGQANWGNVL